MMEIFNISNVIGVLINSFAYIFICSKLLEEKIDFKNLRYYIIHSLFALIMLLNYFYINSFIRIILMVFIIFLVCHLLFKKDIKESFLCAFLSEIVVMISELAFAISISLFINNPNQFFQSFAGKLITNTVISVIAILVSNIPILMKIKNGMLNLINKTKSYYVIIIMIVLLISINFIFVMAYYKYDLTYAVIINTVISVIYLIICYKFLNTQHKFSKINEKYTTTINSLKEYEEILDVYRVSSHENKNQLLTIRSMIVKKEKDIPKYIDTIVDNKIKDDEKLMFDTNIIPAGGLRAVIYSKMLCMKDKDIEFKLNVERKVRTVELIELGEDLMLDVCKIVGVFLDNAIEAVETLDKKLIDISLYTNEDNLYVEISNNYKGEFDISKIDDKGYSTKGNSHGYGLSLVKEIVSNNSKLVNIKKSAKEVFTQNLEIKLK